MANNAYDRQIAIDAVESGQRGSRRVRQALYREPRSRCAFRYERSAEHAGPATFYGGDAAGYTDYPELDQAA